MQRGLQMWNSKDGVAWLAVLLASVSFAFGGASHGNLLGAAVVEIAACPLLAICLWNIFNDGAWRRYQLSVAFVIAVWLLLLLQLVPTPLSLYALVPGRAQAMVAIDLVGLRPQFLPLSMNPEATWLAVLGAVPVTAIFSAVLAGPERLQHRLIKAYLVLALVGLILGVAQITTRIPALNLYSWTPIGEFVGPFANRNHQAAFLLAALPLSAAWSADAREQRRWGAGLVLPAAACLITIFALAVIRSRFGVLLVIPVMTATMALAAFRGGKGAGSRRAVVSAVFIAGIALSVIVPLALSPIIQRFTSEGGQQSRVEIWRSSLTVARLYSPLGAGPGSFDRVYRAAEAPAQIQPSYVNEAHNDYLQVFLETGLPGVIVLVVGLVGTFVAGWKAWRSFRSDALLAKAATISLATLALHSVVDYPLRTPSLAVFAGLLGGLVVRAGTASNTQRKAIEQS
jgi:O-antigen ligase